jgi:hypothetical protein
MILAASMFINLKLHSLIEINFEDEIEKRENEINIKKISPSDFLSNYYKRFLDVIQSIWSV